MNQPGCSQTAGEHFDCGEAVLVGTMRQARSTLMRKQERRVLYLDAASGAGEVVAKAERGGSGTEAAAGAI